MSENATGLSLLAYIDAYRDPNYMMYASAVMWGGIQLWRIVNIEGTFNIIDISPYLIILRSYFSGIYERIEVYITDNPIKFKY